MSQTVQPDTAQLLDRLGGRRGVIDGALPPVVFLVVNAGAGLGPTARTSVQWAALAAVATGLGIVLLRVAQRESLKAALRGLAGLGVAVAFAAWSGEARDYFLPGIWVDAAYAVGFAGSAVVGHPLVGVLYGMVHRTGRTWRDMAGLRRVLTVATWGWTLVFAARAGVQTLFYLADQPELLGLSKLLLGWPLTFLAVVLTLGAARKARAGHCPAAEPRAR